MERLKIGLVTTWAMPCGIAEYSRNLVNNCPDVDFKIVSNPFHVTALAPRLEDVDIINFQYESGFLGIFSPGVMDSFGKPTVLTLHDSYPVSNRLMYPFTNEADAVVIHEKTTDGFRYIPQPIAVSDSIATEPKLKVVATAGFPLPQKGFVELAQAASILHGLGVVDGVKYIAPRNPHCDTYAMSRTVCGICPHTEYVTEWYEQNAVIELLKECAVMVFPYHDGKPGISSAVRLGLATGRPIVLSRCTMFRDLYEYEDEIEFCPTSAPQEIVDAVIRVLENGKRPNRVLQDMNWKVAGRMYKDVYQDVFQSVAKCA